MSVITTPADPAPSSFEAARSAYQAARQRGRDFTARYEGIKAAIFLEKLPDAERQAEQYRWARDAVRAAFGDAGPPRKWRFSSTIAELERLLEETEEQLAAHRVEIERVQDAWSHARRRRADEVAQQFIPQHRAAVSRLISAVEELSRAIAAEQAIRLAYADASPEPTHAGIPDCGGKLGVGVLSDFRSPLSAWAREMRRIGAA